jgi:hypothetical protein
MPVNMDPKKRRRHTQPETQASRTESERAPSAEGQPPARSDPAVGPPADETEADREKALADAEWKNLWDATEVIDMDKW